MNKLCCKVNPMFLCKACGMTVCSVCYDIGAGAFKPKVEREQDDQYRVFSYSVEYHDRDGQCLEGANTWLNEDDNDSDTLIFGKK